MLLTDVKFWSTHSEHVPRPVNFAKILHASNLLCVANQ